MARSGARLGLGHYLEALLRKPGATLGQRHGRRQGCGPVHAGARRLVGRWAYRKHGDAEGTRASTAPMVPSNGVWLTERRLAQPSPDRRPLLTVTAYDQLLRHRRAKGPAHVIEEALNKQPDAAIVPPAGSYARPPSAPRSPTPPKPPPATDDGSAALPDRRLRHKRVTPADRAGAPRQPWPVSGQGRRRQAAGQDDRPLRPRRSSLPAAGMTR